ncbi:FCD domain-containing protein [Salinibacterium sp. G-O1]|uniref:FadR/GntR family transcriptional regulator n=1 Tax=Salinibacterium sp. G-O1 TaxID=3046208 RepID=UPI0024BA72FC|nr:FCD domain-containing protein [Salinibacterium sp. G-O1]MDJ0334320.1 FCD domain-containing protein [Salinibacterium sp. G-O1]
MAAMTKALDGLREMISSGELAKEQRFPPEPELCERLGVSRGALREALRTLGALGVIEARHGSGTYVSKLDPADIVRSFSLTVDLLPLEGLLQLFEIRRVLEAHAAAQAAARCTPEESEHLNSLVAQMEAEPDQRVAADLDRQFHDLICRIAGNPTIASLMDVFRSRSSDYNILEGPDGEAAQAASDSGHRSMASAITSHDPVAAASAAGSHVAQTEHWLRRFMDATEH